MAKAGPGQFLEFLRAKKSGDLVTEVEILAAVDGWKPSTLATYRKKNKLGRFIAVVEPPGTFRVVQDGDLVTEADINAALSQVAPRTVSVERDDRLGGQLGEYVLIRPLGGGAVGAVWEARLEGTDRSVAVKVCSPRPDLLEPSVFTHVKDRFRRESRLGPRMKHDAVITYLDHGEHLTSSFLVMELAQCSLRDELSARGRLTAGEAARIGRRIVLGLDWLHSQSCIHRDIKPPNVLLAPRGYVLGDLGILRWGDLNHSFTSAGTITKPSIQLGSWNYMAPEQVENAHGASSASDVYALGITLFEMVTGSVPTPHRVAAGQLGAPSEFAALNGLIHRMTQYDPGARPGLGEVDAVLTEMSAGVSAM